MAILARLQTAVQGCAVDFSVRHHRKAPQSLRSLPVATRKSLQTRAQAMGVRSRRAVRIAQLIANGRTAAVRQIPLILVPAAGRLMEIMAAVWLPMLVRNPLILECLKLR